MKITRRRIVAAAAIVAVGMQLVPLDRSNPPVEADFDGPPAVEEVLRRSCYDCHSNESRWPWYSWIAPASYFVVDHVHEAREHLNFSRWGRMPAEERADAREECWEEVSEGEMPLREYLWLHGDARLNQEDRRILRNWAGEARADDD